MKKPIMVQASTIVMVSFPPDRFDQQPNPIGETTLICRCSTCKKIIKTKSVMLSCPYCDGNVYMLRKTN